MCRPNSPHNDLRAPKPNHQPGVCPFTIRRLNSTTHLIRENDGFGEFPHIYAKLCSTEKPDGSKASVLVITDTGVGTKVPNPGNAPEPDEWTIYSFLEHTINPCHKIPYLIICSHCHWDHILGIKYFVSQPSETSTSEKANNIVVASSRDPSFLQPWDRLNFHSLCEDNKIPAPKYEVGVWAEDNSRLKYAHHNNVLIDLGIITLHTPGHTPDSLSWFDVEERVIYVGDSLYERESNETRSASWVKERPAPIMFTLEGDILDWWLSIGKVMDFVEQENARAGKAKVKLAAGHVTAEADAYDALVGAKEFMARLLLGEVRQCHMDSNRGEPMGHWTDDSPRHPGEVISKFSVGAPVIVIDKGKTTISQVELKTWLSSSKTY